MATVPGSEASDLRMVDDRGRDRDAGNAIDLNRLFVGAADTRPGLGGDLLGALGDGVINGEDLRVGATVPYPRVPRSQVAAADHGDAALCRFAHAKSPFR